MDFAGEGEGVGWVVDSEVAEGDITDDEVVLGLSALEFFVAHAEGSVFGVEVLEDGGGDFIFFDESPVHGVGAERRHESHSCGGFEGAGVGGYAEVAGDVPDLFDELGDGVVGVEGGGSGGVVFVWGKEAEEFLSLFGIGGLFRVEESPDGSPACESGEFGLVFGGGCALCVLEVFQGSDGFEGRFDFLAFGGAGEVGSVVVGELVVAGCVLFQSLIQPRGRTRMFCSRSSICRSCRSFCSHWGSVRRLWKASSLAWSRFIPVLTSRLISWARFTSASSSAWLSWLFWRSW